MRRAGLTEAELDEARAAAYLASGESETVARMMRPREVVRCPRCYATPGKDPQWTMTNFDTMRADYSADWTHPENYREAAPCALCRGSTYVRRHTKRSRAWELLAARAR